MKDALFHPKYKKATWINLGYIMLHELCGANPISKYSNKIFKHMHNLSKSRINLRYVSMILNGIFVL